MPVKNWLLQHRGVVFNKWLGWLLLVGLVLALVLRFLYAVSPASVVAQYQISKDKLLNANSLMQELPGPRQWEFGQHDTAHSQQLITFAQASEDWKQYESSVPQRGLRAGSILFGYNIPSFEEPLQDRVSAIHEKGETLLNEHAGMLAALQDFSEFNCLAYLKFDAAPAVEVKRIITQTQDGIQGFTFKSYQDAAEAGRQSLQKFHAAVSAPKSIANAVKPCQNAQETMQQEFGSAWQTEKEKFNQLVAETASDISKVQTAVSRP